MAKITIRKWLDGCLKRIREKEQSLIAGLRAMNEPVMHTLRPLEENEKEEEEDEDDNSSEDESKVSSDKKGKWTHKHSSHFDLLDKNFWILYIFIFAYKDIFINLQKKKKKQMK